MGIESDRLPSHYFDGFATLFGIENALRVHVYATLKSFYRDKWCDRPIAHGQDSHTTIAALARRRQRQVAEYLGSPASGPLVHLTSGELVGLILEPNEHWSLFSKYFPLNRSTLEVKLREMVNIRNAMAHFRAVSPDDIALLKDIVRGPLRLVEESIRQLTNMPHVIPVPPIESWHDAILKTMSTSWFGDDAVVYESDDHSCVCFTLNQCVVPEAGKWWTLDLRKLLETSSGLASFLTYACEEFGVRVVERGEGPRPWKTVTFVFQRSVLAEHFPAVVQKISGMLDTMGRQLEAASWGEVPEGGTTILRRATVGQGARVNGVNLGTPRDHTDPPELWRNVDLLRKDYSILGARHHPWFPL